MLKKEKKDELVSFGVHLYEMRKRSHLTQMQMAEILDIDRRQVSRYETGEAEMGALLYAKMQDALSVKIDDRLDELLQLWGVLSSESKMQLLDLAKVMKKADDTK